jgi:hypothetical protein
MSTVAHKFKNVTDFAGSGFLPDKMINSEMNIEA